MHCVSSSAGKKITSGKIGKIVGLDPAMPLFKYNNLEGRLAATDASYVESIHTCAGRLGMTKPIGSASFFPNGGRRQPGCSSWDMVGACSHIRATSYFIESVIRSEFYAVRCESFQKFITGNCLMTNGVVSMGGEPGNSRLEGRFYLQTNDDHQKRFAKGRKGIKEVIWAAKRNGKKPRRFSKLRNGFKSLLNNTLKRIHLS